MQINNNRLFKKKTHKIHNNRIKQMINEFSLYRRMSLINKKQNRFESRIIEIERSELIPEHPTFSPSSIPSTGGRQLQQNIQTLQIQDDFTKTYDLIDRLRLPLINATTANPEVIHIEPQEKQQQQESIITEQIKPLDNERTLNPYLNKINYKSEIKPTCVCDEWKSFKAYEHMHKLQEKLHILYNCKIKNSMQHTMIQSLIEKKNIYEVQKTTKEIKENLLINRIENVTDDILNNLQSQQNEYDVYIYIYTLIFFMIYLKRKKVRKVWFPNIKKKIETSLQIKKIIKKDTPEKTGLLEWIKDFLKLKLPPEMKDSIKTIISSIFKRARF